MKSRKIGLYAAAVSLLWGILIPDVHILAEEDVQLPEEHIQETESPEIPEEEPEEDQESSDGEDETVLPDGTDPEIDPDVDPVQEILQYDSEDEGIAQLREVQEEDRQTAPTVEYSEEEKQAYVSSFLLSRIRTGGGQFDSVSDLSGNDSTEDDDIVRTEDIVTYVFSYSCALTQTAEYNTVSGAAMHVRYELPCLSETAEFELGSMPWFIPDDAGAPVRTEEGRQILEGVRILPEMKAGERTYSVPCAGTLNCVIRIHNAMTGTVLTPSFYAYVMPDESDGITADNRDSSVRISCGTFAWVKLSKINNESAWGTYTNCYMTNGESKAISGRLKSFQYEIVVGKENGIKMGVMPLDPSSFIHVRYRKDYQGFTSTGSPIPITAGVYDIKTEGSDTAGIRGHTIEENNVLHRFYKNGVHDLGTIRMIGTDAASARLECFEIEDIVNTMPGDTASRGAVIICQQQNQSSNNDRYICSLLISAITVKGLYDVSPKTINMRVSESFEQNTIYPGLWNTSVHLYSVNASLRNSAYLSGSVNSTSNVITFRQHFKATANHTNIPVTEAGREKSFDTWLLWDNRLVEPELFDGHPYLRQTYYASYLGNTSSKEENYNVRYITKRNKNAPLFGSTAEMKNCNMMSFDNLCFFNTYEQAIAYAGSITGILVEARNVTDQKLYADNIHTVEIMLQPTARALEIGEPARITTGTWSWSNSITTSMASASGKGTLPPSANTVQKADRNAIYTCTRWNGNTIDTSSLTSNNQVFFGATLKIDSFQCRTQVLNDDRSKTAVKEMHQADTLQFYVIPEIMSEADSTIPFADLRIKGPFQNEETAGTVTGLTALFEDGTEVPLSDGMELSLSEYSGSSGHMEVIWMKNDIVITFEDTLANAVLPQIIVATAQDVRTLSEDVPLILKAEIDGDARPVNAQTGKTAQASVSFYDLSAWLISQTVDKAKAEYRDDLVYIVNVRNRSRYTEEAEITWHLPENGVLDTVLNPDAQLRIDSACADMQDGTQIPAEIENGDSVRAVLEIPDEESVKLIVHVHAEKLVEPDVLHASASLRIRDMDIDSNLVETKAEKRIVLPETGGTGRTTERMASFILFLCAGLLRHKDRRRRK